MSETFAFIYTYKVQVSAFCLNEIRTDILPPILTTKIHKIPSNDVSIMRFAEPTAAFFTRPT